MYIDVATLLQIAQQKTAKTMKKNLFPTYRPYYFSQYETGTTGIFYAQI